MRFRRGRLCSPWNRWYGFIALSSKHKIIESILLNILNFETLIATKSARIYLAINKGTILELDYEGLKVLMERCLPAERLISEVPPQLSNHTGWKGIWNPCSRNHGTFLDSRF
jgi:hypothetical protein